MDSGSRDRTRSSWIALPNEGAQITTRGRSENLTPAQWLRLRRKNIVRGMDRSRANHGAKRRVSWHAQFHNYPQWIRMPDLGCLRDSVSSGQKRFFAIVSPPTPTSVAGKTIRRIMIFDNHPDSLRLVLKSGLDLDGEAAASRRERRTSIICGFILIAMVVAALLWPLCW
jgi:hypothetical protein